MLDKIKNIKISTLVCAIFLVFSICYFYIAMGLKYWGGSYAPGPGFIPRWTSGVMVVLSIFALVKSFKESGPVISDMLPKERSAKINLFVCWGALFFLLFFVKILGFVITSSVSLTAMFSRGTTWPKAALIGVVLTLISFFVFSVLLKMQLPVNQFGF